MGYPLVCCAPAAARLTFLIAGIHSKLVAVLSVDETVVLLLGCTGGQCQEMGLGEHLYTPLLLADFAMGPELNPSGMSAMGRFADLCARVPVRMKLSPFALLFLAVAQDSSMLLLSNSAGSQHLIAPRDEQDSSNVGRDFTC